MHYYPPVEEITPELYELVARLEELVHEINGDVPMTVILTVEDEFLIRENLRHLLAHAGHEVISTADADEAIEVLESRSDIRVVITDVNMPGSMDGLKQFAELPAQKMCRGTLRGRAPASGA